MSVTVAAADEEWTEMSRHDDAMVAQMLLRLRHAVPPPRPSSALRLVWSVRQRRSGSRKDDNEPKKNKNKKEKAVESTRASPSTPLSFSAATSTSCGAAEESSSRPTRSKASTLKVSSNRTKKSIKKAKKKKTLVELKVEEEELLKEKTSLKNELAKLRLRVEKERVKNEIFKRKKLDLQQIGSVKSDELDLQNDQVMEVEKCETVFELPDLNLPFEQQHYASAAAEGIYGTS